MSRVYNWELLTREDIAGLAGDALLVIPLGSTEQHGPHLATGTDALLARGVAESAAEKAVYPECILLAPTVAFGASDHHLQFGATLSLSVRTLARVLHDLLRSASRSGCRRVFLLNGHGGNTQMCRAAIAEASRLYGIAAATANIADFVDGEVIGGPVRGHAGFFETSGMLAVYPKGVRLERARRSPGGRARQYERGLVVAEPGRWQELQGFTDDPTKASAKAGRVALDLCAERVAMAYGTVARLEVGEESDGSG